MITSLQLQNFKCFKDLQINLKQINLFTGRNGSGKSSVMQSLLLIAQSLDRDNNIHKLTLNGRYVNLGTMSDVTNEYVDPQNFSIIIGCDDSSDPTLDMQFGNTAPDSKQVTITKLQSKINFISSRVTQNAANGGTTTPNEDGSGLSISPVSGNPIIMEISHSYFVSADRRGQVNEMKYDNAENVIGIHGENVINVYNNQSDEIKAEVLKALRHIMSEGYINSKVDEDKVYLYLDSLNDSKGLKPSNVGFGYSYVLTIILNMLLAEKDSKIFIENPEAHLHPKAQHNLVEFMYNIALRRHLQLFIETHSDHIINGSLVLVKSHDSDVNVDNFSVHFFELSQETDGNAKHSELEVRPSGLITMPPKDFCDQIDKDMEFILDYEN